MTSDDIEYYRKRAVDETELSFAATNEAVAMVHAQLALHYSAIVDFSGGDDPNRHDRDWADRSVGKPPGLNWMV